MNEEIDPDRLTDAADMVLAFESGNTDSELRPSSELVEFPDLVEAYRFLNRLGMLDQSQKIH